MEFRQRAGPVPLPRLSVRDRRGTSGRVAGVLADAHRACNICDPLSPELLLMVLLAANVESGCRRLPADATTAVNNLLPAEHPVKLSSSAARVTIAALIRGSRGGPLSVAFWRSPTHLRVHPLRQAPDPHEAEKPSCGATMECKSVRWVVPVVVRRCRTVARTLMIRNTEMWI